MNFYRIFSDFNMKNGLQCLWFFEVICVNQVVTFKCTINNHVQFDWNSF